MYQEQKGESRIEIWKYILAMEILSDFYINTTHETMWQPLKVDCGKFKMCTISCKTTTKITKRRVTAEKAAKEIKPHHEKY